MLLQDIPTDAANNAANEAAKREAGNKRTDAFLIQLIDLVFVAVPITIFSLVFWQKNMFPNFWVMPEWSFAATVLFGQTLTKLVSGAIENPLGFRAPRVGIFVAILVFMLIMSSAVLLLVLNQTVTASSATQLSRGLMVAQFVMLLLAIPSFFIIGATAEYNRMKP